MNHHCPPVSRIPRRAENSGIFAPEICQLPLWRQLVLVPYLIVRSIGHKDDVDVDVYW